MEAQWIPRSLNERADLLSLFVDKDDWRVNPSMFRLVDAKWVPTRLTISLPRFNSKFGAVSMPWCRIGLKRITGFALRWVSSWTPFEFSRLVPVRDLDYS